MNPRRTDDPQPGYFKLRLVKGGPFVGAAIFHRSPCDPETGEEMDRSPMWEAWKNGKIIREPSPDAFTAGVYEIWMTGLEISEAEYRHLVADREWCRNYAPGSPEANPTKKVDLNALDMELLLP